MINIIILNIPNSPQKCIMLVAGVGYILFCSCEIILKGRKWKHDLKLLYTQGTTDNDIER